MRKVKGKLLAGTLIGTLLVSASFSGCGTSESASEGDTSFTYLLATTVDHGHYTEYEDGPVTQYWMNMDWDADGDGESKNLDIDFVCPASMDTSSDMVNTLLSTGEYTDVMDLQTCSETASQLYEEGIALDITDYVEEYMPNYQAWIKEHGYEGRLTNEIDGEERYIQLYGLSDMVSDMWGGQMYRRDWIVKYGTNPVTGEAFTGGYDEDGNWTDDVVFPSGETDPIYISDWEWMLDIFQTALEEQGVTDGYAMQLYYMGDIPLGDFETGFGCGCNGIYLDENGKAQYGGGSDGMRAYLECLATWYKNGWIDQSFDERSSDIFFSIDSATVYSGKCGTWWGTIGQLEGNMDTGDDLTSGIYVAAAPQPINDVYGTDACKNKIPTTFFSNAPVSTGVIITDKAEDKDLATLFTALDYMYSLEGGLLHYYGFSYEQQEELQNELYIELDFPGGYYVADDGTYVINTDRDKVDGLAEATCAQRIVGLAVNDVDKGNTDSYQHSMDMWNLYENTGTVTSEITNKLDPDKSAEVSLIDSNVQTYNSVQMPLFITGERDITDDADWEDYCEGLMEYNPQLKADYINEILGK